MRSVFKSSLVWLVFLAGLVGFSYGESEFLKDSPQNKDSELKSANTVEVETQKFVYVIPINEAINQPNLFVLRRGLKEAIRKKADMVLLDMDTPGGRLDICLEMMEMLDYFEGATATYINPDAISAGAFIASACDKIYFSPKGKIGAAAVIQGTGEDVPDTARMKIESYLLANIRVLSEGYRYRTEVVRAMFDSEYELIIDEEIIKPKGELLTLTANQAVQEYGEPAVPLLGDGIAPSIEVLLNQEFGVDGYRLERYEMTYSEEWAKWLANITPILLGVGMLLLFIEFKKSSYVPFSKPIPSLTPALFTRPSIFLKSLIIFFTACSHCFGSVNSANAKPTSRFLSLYLFTALIIVFLSLPTIMGIAPSSSKTETIPEPIPFEPPVTIIILPFSPKSILTISYKIFGHLFPLFFL